MSPILGLKVLSMNKKLFFVKDPNENVLEIKTLTSNPE
jgi:hypothetical protein